MASDRRGQVGAPYREYKSQRSAHPGETPDMMKAALLVLALGVVAASASCPAPSGDVKLKQSQIQKIVEHVNRPYLTDTELPSYDDETKMKGIGKYPQRQVFSLFDERQWGEVDRMLELMMKAASFEEFLKVSEAIRQRANEDMFFFAFTTAIVHRPDTQGLNAPRVQDVYPDKFFTQEVIALIKEAIHRGEKNPMVNDTCHHANIMDYNNRLTYFTEDMGMNAHHFHWHVVNPAIWSEKYGGVKDRRGEAFYWMHRQMLARYDAERLSNYLPRTTPFEDWDHPIHVGYAPHLSVDRTGYTYAFRPEDLTLRNLPELSKNQMLLWRNRVWSAIHSGWVLAKNGTKIRIDQEDPLGTDIIGHLVESSRQTVNRPYYGNLHCYAHVIAAKITDPDGKYEQNSGAMYDVTTSARDPFFYRWHKFIDNIFQEYKNTLPEYTKEEITWQGVKIESVEVKGDKSSEANLLTTFWDYHPFKIGKYFSFTAQSTAEVRVSHLQHEGFTYKMELVNNAGDNKEAFIRVFLAPKYDETGKPFTIDEMRPLLIEMDKFLVKLKAGKNSVTRHSSESSVSVGDKHIFGSAETMDNKDQCKCGWPNYMLLPKGRRAGMKYRLIVVATNWAEDKLHDDISCMCKGAPAYCRMLYNQVPDRRPLGYPFDRKIHTRTFKEVDIQNMMATDITIKFTGDAMLH